LSDLKIGDIDDHYKAFMKKNTAGKCPFCRISDILGLNHTPREAYDHSLSKALYQFNTVNFRNHVPACHHCNNSYKTSKELAFTPKDPARATPCRKVFCPHVSPGHTIEVTINLRKFDVDHPAPDDIQLTFGLSAFNEEIESWKDVYGIEKRYKAKSCRQGDGRSHDDFLKALTRQTSRNPFADSNFLKIALLNWSNRVGLLKGSAEEA
jgi:hypothetical protein